MTAVTLWQGRFGERSSHGSCSPSPRACPSTAGWHPTTSPAAVPTSWAWSGPACSPTTTAAPCWPPWARWRGSWPKAACHLAGDEDVHTAIERARHRARPAAPASTPGAAATTRWPPTCPRPPNEPGPGGQGHNRPPGGAPGPGREAGDTYLPGYTHMQKANPCCWPITSLAHGWALARDVDRIAATRRRLDVSPLGAGALAGSSLPLDPDWRGA